MIHTDSDGGLIRFGPFAIAWGNADTACDFPGFTTVSWGDYSLEFGEIDAGNGIHVTKYDGQGDIEYTRPIIQL